MHTPTKYITLYPKRSNMGVTKKVILSLFALTIVVGFVRGQSMLNASVPVVQASEVSNATSTVSDAPCLKLAHHTFFCGDEAGTNSKLQDLYTENQALKSKQIKAFVTQYSRKDSCHNPSGDKCLTAIGRDTKAGVTVACPRNLKLGTKVMIDGFTYTCEDRYSTYLDEKRGLPTFDIFTEDYDAALQWGIKQRTVTVLN